MRKYLDIASLVPVGHANAISRGNLCIRARMTDREVRRFIELSDVLIVNLGTGYFIPGEGEEHLVRQYRRQELAYSLNIKTAAVSRIYMLDKEDDESFEQISLEGIVEI